VGQTGTSNDCMDVAGHSPDRWQWELGNGVLVLQGKYTFRIQQHCAADRYWEQARGLEQVGENQEVAGI